MAKLGARFDATAHDTEQRDYEDLPAGIYQFEVAEADVVETGPEGARTGSGMKYTANVLAPEELAGRKFFGFINLENRNAQAQEIGQRELASLCRAIGIDGVEDTDELLFQAYTAKLGLGKPSKAKNADGSPQYPARMEVKRYFFPDQGNVPVPAVDSAQPSRPAPSNDNRSSANDNRTSSSQQPAGGAKKRPWG